MRNVSPLRGKVGGGYRELRFLRLTPSLTLPRKGEGIGYGTSRSGDDVEIS